MQREGRAEAKAMEGGLLGVLEEQQVGGQCDWSEGQSNVRRLVRSDKDGWSRTGPGESPTLGLLLSLTSRKSKARRVIIPVSAACVPMPRQDLEYSEGKLAP